VRVDEVAELNREGILASAKWSSVSRVEPRDDPGPGHEVSDLDCSSCHATNDSRLEAGREVFKLECSACHTVRGYNPVAPLVKDWSEEYIDLQLQRLDELKPFMPPFIGKEEERKALAAWLASLD
jgi:mono/diheme cytochrome c family protein